MDGFAPIRSTRLNRLSRPSISTGGGEAAAHFVQRWVGAEIERAADLEHMKNYKSLLQQMSQKSFGETPSYRVLDEKGPDHSKCFKISAMIGPQVYPAAWGTSKKEAEQRAARNALHQLDGRELPYLAD